MGKDNINDVEHEVKLSEIWHAVKMIDERPFKPGLIKSVLDQGINSGQLNLFVLECVASYPAASNLGVGKVVCRNEQITNYSTAVYAAPAITHLVDHLHQFGIRVNYEIFLGDDDYIYSVDQPWRSDKLDVASLIDEQVVWLDQNLPQEYHLNESDKLSVKKWTEVEKNDGQISSTRQMIVNYFQAAVAGEIQLAGPIQSRLNAFIAWRKEIIRANAVVINESHLVHLAVNELSSFVNQGFWAPQLIGGGININTFPGSTFADDLCMRLGGEKIFDSMIEFGTIHPSVIHLEGKLLSINKEKPNNAKSRTVFTCGDPKGNPNF